MEEEKTRGKMFKEFKGKKKFCYKNNLKKLERSNR